MGLTASREEVVLAMGQEDQTLLVLLRHCRDMKRQETRLRLATWLLLCSCAALCMFAVHVHLRRGESPASGRPEVTAEHGPAYSRKDNCINCGPQTNSRRPSIHLEYVESEGDKSNGLHIKWHATIGEEYYNETQRAIVIPQKGTYYVYVRIALRWSSVDPHRDENETSACHGGPFNLQLHEWHDSYPKDMKIMDAIESIPCTLMGNGNIYLGRIFDLKVGSHIKVWLERGHKLIDVARTSFGAVLQ